jgi:hypothetical protein
LKQTKRERAIFCRALGFAFEICVNDHTGGVVTGVG